jgi:hypothetical protein
VTTLGDGRSIGAARGTRCQETVSHGGYTEAIAKPRRFVEMIDGGDETCPVLGRLGQVEPVAQPAIAGADRRRADSARDGRPRWIEQPSRGGTMFGSAAPRPTTERWTRRRRRTAAAIAAGAAAVFLSGCGFVAAFVPPLSVGDPLGVGGQIVTATLQDGAIQMQSTTHLDAVRTFDVPDLEANLHGFGVASFHTNAGLATEVTLSGPAGAIAPAYPERITFTRALIDAQLWDDVNGSVAFTLDLALALPFDRMECSLDGCTYLYAGTDSLVDVLDLEITDRSTLETLVSILVLRETETPNHGAFRVAIEVEASTSLSGYVATFQLTSTGSTIRLGG